MQHSSQNKLHIISSDIPFPADYGGAIDVYYKLKNLSEAGVSIYFHCFEYGRARQPHLETLCTEVHYYQRQQGLKGLSMQHPYMMFSRRHEDLLQNLLRIEAPIFFEGVHTTFLLDHPLLSTRKKIIRNQNVEQEYFALLGQQEKKWWRKLYYFIETGLLKKKEAKLQAADAFYTVSLHDHDFFKKLYPQQHHLYIPSFQPYDTVESATGKGNYILYQGNLGHIENENAVLWLAENVLPQIKFPVVIAGKNPSAKMKAALASLPYVQLQADLSFEAMQQLIKDAHIHLLPTGQASGLKLKLLNALFCGRHVIADDQMLFGTGIESLCRVANGGAQMIAAVNELMELPFTEKEKIKRATLLHQHYNNKSNAQKIINDIFPV